MALRVDVWEGIQENIVDDAEDGSSSADTKRESYDGHAREPAVLSHHAKTVF